MKNIVFACLLIGLAFRATEASGQTAGPKNVLFVGDSYIYAYEIPKILDGLAAASGKHTKFVEHIAGGRGLAWHWSNTSYCPDTVANKTAPDAITSGNWDLVILEDGNIPAPADNIKEFQAVTPKYLALKSKAEKTNYILYTGFMNPMVVTKAGVKEGMDIYTKQANVLGIPCAPVALAVANFREKAPKIALIDSETGLKYGLNKKPGHPSPIGAYIGACTIYAAIYGESPVGNTFHKSGDGTPIDDDDALLAQKVSWDTWNAYKPLLKNAGLESKAAGAGSGGFDSFFHKAATTPSPAP